MKKIVDGKKYDTDTAKFIIQIDEFMSIYQQNRFVSYYKKNNGTYFYVYRCPNSENYVFQDVSEEYIRRVAEQKLSVEQYESIFGEVSE